MSNFLYTLYNEAIDLVIYKKYRKSVLHSYISFLMAFVSLLNFLYYQYHPVYSASTNNVSQKLALGIFIISGILLYFFIKQSSHRKRILINSTTQVLTKKFILNEKQSEYLIKELQENDSLDFKNIFQVFPLILSSISIISSGYLTLMTLYISNALNIESKQNKNTLSSEFLQSFKPLINFFSILIIIIVVILIIIFVYFIFSKTSKKSILLAATYETIYDNYIN